MEAGNELEAAGLKFGGGAERSSIYRVPSMHLASSQGLDILHL